MVFQVGHIIELQVTPASMREEFNSVFNYELLDAASNQSSGPTMAASMAAERAMQVAHDPTAGAEFRISMTFSLWAHPLASDGFPRNYKPGNNSMRTKIQILRA